MFQVVEFDFKRVILWFLIRLDGASTVQMNVRWLLLIQWGFLWNGMIGTKERLFCGEPAATCPRFVPVICWLTMHHVCGTHKNKAQRYVSWHWIQWCSAFTWQQPKTPVISSCQGNTSEKSDIFALCGKESHSLTLIWQLMWLEVAVSSPISIIWYQKNLVFCSTLHISLMGVTEGFLVTLLPSKQEISWSLRMPLSSTSGQHLIGRTLPAPQKHFSQSVCNSHYGSFSDVQGCTS